MARRPICAFVFDGLFVFDMLVILNVLAALKALVALDASVALDVFSDGLVALDMLATFGGETGCVAGRIRSTFGAPFCW